MRVFTVPGTPVYNAPETFPATHGNANVPNKLEYDVQVDIFFPMELF